MTNEEAIYWLKGDVTGECGDCDGVENLGCERKCQSLIALDMVIEALKKQKAKKPIEYQPLNYCCPICHRELFFDKYDENLVNTYWYCNKCGQKIDWSDYE